MIILNFLFNLTILVFFKIMENIDNELEFILKNHTLILRTYAQENGNAEIDDELYSIGLTTNKEFTLSKWNHDSKKPTWDDIVKYAKRIMKQNQPVLNLTNTSFSERYNNVPIPYKLYFYEELLKKENPFIYFVLSKLIEETTQYDPTFFIQTCSDEYEQLNNNNE